MTWNLYYYAKVEVDLISAKKWYRLQQVAGLDVRFAAEVKKAINKIKKEPFIYEVRYKNVRIAYLNVFPFGVHYYINESETTITIIAILHQHRDPQTYFDR